MNHRVTGPSSILSHTSPTDYPFETRPNDVIFLESRERHTVSTTNTRTIPTKRKILPSFCMYGTRLTGNREERRGLKAALGDMVGTGIGGRYL